MSGSDEALLAGLTVLDFTRVLAGPYCTRLLADLGARVIKVERPGEGDETRRGHIQLEKTRTDQATYFIRINAGKSSVAIDLSHPKAREVVLDLGSGGGIDVLLSARRVGPTGKAYGLDMTEEMLALAHRNATQAGARNVEFLKGHIEAIPLPAGTVDVVISNCVINLSVDKPAVFAETYRVLKPGGRLGVSDIVAEDRLSPADRAERGSHVGCIAGALSKAEYQAQLAEAGFAEVSVTFTHQVGDGLHSAIIKATRPRATATVPTAARRELPVVGQSGCC